MGKALLAFAPPETVDAVIDNGLDQYTPFTIVSAPALRRALAIARMTRVATTRQELRLHTAAVAVPVVAGGGAVVAAIELTISGAGYQLHVIQSAVVVAARALSRELAAGQCRTRPDRFAVLQGSAVIPLRRDALHRARSGREFPDPVTAVRAEHTQLRSHCSPNWLSSVGSATGPDNIAGATEPSVPDHRDRPELTS